MSDSPFDDVFEDAMQEVSEDGLSRLRKLYDKRSRVATEVEDLTARLAVATKELEEYDQRKLPELFDEVGVTWFTVGNRQIGIKEKLYGSLPKKDLDKRYEAIEELKLWGV